MNLRLLLPVALLACAGTAAAQQPAPAAPPQARPAQVARPAQPQLTPAQQAQLAQQNAQMTQAAQQVIQMVDSNRVGEIWDAGSATMKRLVTRDEFVKQITIDRNKLGKPTARGKATVTRSQFPAGARVPQGIYLNVAVPTTFANAPKGAVRELVSFRLDEDKTWRVSGYSLR